MKLKMQSTNTVFYRGLAEKTSQKVFNSFLNIDEA